MNSDGHNRTGSIFYLFWTSWRIVLSLNPILDKFVKESLKHSFTSEKGISELDIAFSEQAVTLVGKF